MMKNITSIVVCFAAFVLGACAYIDRITENSDRAVFRKIESLCNAKRDIKSGADEVPCVVRLDEVFEFPWEKLYVFNLSVENDEICKVLGVEHIRTSKDYSIKLYFMKAGEIVHFQEKVVDVDEQVQAGEISFNTVGKYPVFEHTDSVVVSKNRLGDGHYLSLTRK